MDVITKSSYTVLTGWCVYCTVKYESLNVILLSVGF